MTWEQGSGQIRLIVGFVAGIVVARGWTTADVTTLTDIMMQAGGGLAAIVAAYKSFMALSPKAIAVAAVTPETLPHTVAEVDKQPAIRGIITARTPEGLALAKDVPSPTVVPASTAEAARVADAISKGHA